MYTIDEIKKNLKNASQKKRIIFPEGTDAKITSTAHYICDNDLGIPYLVLRTKADKKEIIDNRVKLIFIDEYDIDDLAKRFFDIRNGKVTIEDAKKMVQEPNYFATMLLEIGEVDCLLGGIHYTTADTLRPALQIVKTKPGVKSATSVIIMKRNFESYLFSDCSLNLNPTSEQLVEIAKLVVDFGRRLKLEHPEVALLSYSTNGSGMGESVDKVRTAKELLDKEKVDFTYDGEIQFDAALIKEVRQKKYKDSKLKKEHPDVFIFPNLDSGNIGYKIAQRFGGFEAVGPFILGLKKPVNDLSRGATLEDVILTAVVTLFQAD